MSLHLGRNSKTPTLARQVLLRSSGQHARYYLVTTRPLDTLKLTLISIVFQSWCN
jgi:hypothetical protein